MTSDWPWVPLFLLISPAIGSFLAVLVDRLPQGTSLFAPSKCAACDTKLRWSQLIPLVSAFRLGHQCATCAAPIPGHLKRIEIAAILGALLAVTQTQDIPSLYALGAAFWCLIALFYCDLLHFRLPNVLTTALLGIGLLLAQLDPTRHVLTALITALSTGFTFWIVRWGYFQLRKREGLGLGDVKLAAGIGAVVGWQLVPIVTLIAALLGLLIALVEWKRSATHVHLTKPMPFGSYLTGATALVLVF